jgi:hypothetical protein
VDAILAGEIACVEKASDDEDVGFNASASQPLRMNRYAVEQTIQKAAQAPLEKPLYGSFAGTKLA